MTTYGPSLPPGFQKSRNPLDLESEPSVSKRSNSSESDKPSNDEDSPSISSVIGPTIPSHFIKGNSSDAERKEVGSEKISMGPSLPPGFQRPKIVAGPQIPDQLRDNLEDSYDSSDDDFVGPSPVLMASEGDYSGASELTRRFERQAKRAKEALEPKVLQREAWMTSLPDSLLAKTIAPALTSTPRTFKRRTDDYEADFSGWTANPNAKGKEEKKEEDSLEVLQYQQALERERQLELQIEKHNKKKRGESLVSIAKKDAKPESLTERRSFDREKDLNIQKVGRMDTEELKKKANDLKERFAPSAKTGQKFL